MFLCLVDDNLDCQMCDFFCFLVLLSFEHIYMSVFLSEVMDGLCEAGGSIPAKLADAYTDFRQYCRGKHETPMVKHFTKENLGWNNMRRYPECSFKGSDTRLILGYVIAVLERPSTVLDAVSRTSYVAARAIDDFLRCVFGTKDDGNGCRKPLLTHDEGKHAADLLKVYLENFLACAKLCFEGSKCFFNLTPKNHYLMHIHYDMEAALRACGANGCILNPALFATQMAEDATGRSSRISRTVHPKTTSLRVAQKWMILAKLFWDKTT